MIEKRLALPGLEHNIRFILTRDQTFTCTDLYYEFYTAYLVRKMLMEYIIFTSWERNIFGNLFERIRTNAFYWGGLCNKWHFRSHARTHKHVHRIICSTSHMSLKAFIPKESIFNKSLKLMTSTLESILKIVFLF